MAKKIRFPLKMKNGAEVRTLEELKENFDLESVLGYFTDGKLETWLADRYYDTEASKISGLSLESSNLQTKICEAFGINYIDNQKGEIDLEYIKRCNDKKNMLIKLTDDPYLLNNIDNIAFNQNDLLNCYDYGIKDIYLFGDTEFTISLSITDVTYYGRLGAKAVVRAIDNVNFKEKNIRFKDIKFRWDTSDITPNDGVYQAEQLIAQNKKNEAISMLEPIAETDHPKALVMLAKLYMNL